MLMHLLGGGGLGDVAKGREQDLIFGEGLRERDLLLVRLGDVHLVDELEGMSLGSRTGSTSCAGARGFCILS